MQEWRKWQNKLLHCVLLWENIHPLDTERKLHHFLNNCVKFEQNHFRDYDKNLELAQLVQQKLDAYKVYFLFIVSVKF